MEIVKGKIGNAITSTASDHIVAVSHDIYDENQERYQDDINDYVLGQIFDVNQILSCFSSGLWENELHWSNVALWDNNKFAITEDLQNQIDELEKVINEHTEDLSENMLEHQSFKIQLQNHLSQLKDLECLTKEHDEQILDLLNGLNCFGDGQWNNDLKWSNAVLWENSNLMCDTFIDIYNKINEHHKAVEKLDEKINSVKKEAADTLKTINETFDNFRKEHKTFQEEHNTFRSEHQNIGKRIDNVVNHQNDIDILNTEQQRQIDILLYSLSTVSNGLWDNDLLWVNNSDWTNYKGVGEGQDRIDDLYEKLAETNDELAKANQEIINNTVLIEENRNYININRTDILQCLSDITDNTEVIENNTEEIAELQQNFVAKHRDVAYQLRAIGREQTAQNDDITKLGEHFGCFVDGQWGDLFVWDNEHLWANELGIVANMQEEISVHESRLSALETALTELLNINKAQQEQLERQQSQLDALMDVFTVTNIGKWQNALLWDNNTKWSDSLLTQQIENGSGTASVTVKSYDVETGTISI